MGPIGIAMAVSIPLLAHLARAGVWSAPPHVYAAAVPAVLGVAIWARGVARRPLTAAAVTVFGALYTGATLAYGYALRYHRFTIDQRSGALLVLLPLILTWTSDIGAYAVGRLMGRHKLIPAVSPGKTVEGALGGLLATMAVAVLFERMLLAPHAHLALPGWRALAFGALISIVAQIGDLAESLLKREAGVKDSSRILPGHGGILDRFDSLFFVLPTAYLLLDLWLVAIPG